MDYTLLLLLLWLIISLHVGCNGQPAVLLRGWRCQSSAVVGVDGKHISTAAYNDSQWYSAGNGDTVMAALVAAGEYGGEDNIFRGIQMQQVGAGFYD